MWACAGSLPISTGLDGADVVAPEALVSSYFISGASSGLGAEMARQLARRGDTVALAARRTDRLEEVASGIGRAGGFVTVHTTDVTDPAAVEEALGEADRVHRGLDAVVVNAGRGGGGRLGTGRGRENRAVLETNLIGALAQIESALKLFRSRGRGHLVLVSSMAALRGLPGSAATYSASKAALAALGESLRTEFSGSDIAVTTLRPGYIRTELNEKASFPYMSRLEPGVRSMIAAMDRQAADVIVPTWPWRPLGWAMRVTPGRLIRRVM